MQGKYRLIGASILLASLWAAIWFVAAVLLVMAPLYVHDQVVEYPGNYAPLYLYDGSPYDRIVIEVHYEQDIRPSVYALEHLQSIVHQYTGKAVDLCLFQDITPDMLPASTDNENISSFGYTFLDQHAHNRPGWLGGNAVMYVLYVHSSVPWSRGNGTSAVAGVSFRAEAGCVMTGTLVENLSIRTGRILPSDDFCSTHRQQLEQARYNLF